VHGFEVDLHWPTASFVEFDGYRFHGTRARFENDRARDAQLQASGVMVMRLTWRQLERESYAVIARIAAAIARRTPAPLR
jgi:very-short-patch-repair endonuclease